MTAEKSTATMEKSYLRGSEVAEDIGVSCELVYL
jgi:hypothetical protein